MWLLLFEVCGEVVEVGWLVVVVVVLVCNEVDVIVCVVILLFE